MTTNEDIAKILGVLGAILGLVEVLLSITGSGQILGHIDIGLALEPIIYWIIALVICILALMVSLSPSGILMIIFGILVILFASTLGGILVILGGIIELLD